MNENNFLFEAQPQKTKDPIKVSDLSDFFSQLSVGDNLYIKRSNGDNINVRIIKQDSEFEFKVKKGKDEFFIMCQSDPRNGGANTFIVSEFDPRTKKFQMYKYNDIVYITVSDKKFLSKIIYDPNLKTSEPKNTNDNNEVNDNSASQPTSNKSNINGLIEKALQRLSTKLEPFTMTVLNTYYNKKDDVKNSIKNLNGNIEAFIQKQMSSNGEKNNENNSPQFISLSDNMEYQDGIWVTTNKLNNQFKSQPQKFSGNPRELKQSLVDVLTVIKTKDLLSLIVSSTERYSIMVDVSPSKTVSFKAISPNRDISVTQNKAYAGKQYKLGQLSTDYTQPDIVRIGNKNKIVLPLYINERIIPSNQVYELEGISAFIYTPSVESVMEETILALNNNIKNSLDGLGEETKIVVNYNTYSNDEPTTQQMSMVVKLKDNVYTIEGCTITDLNGKTISKDSILASYNKADTSRVSGSVLQTIEGMALGNLVSLELFQKNENGDFEDNARELSDTEFTDKELYTMVSQDPTLRDFMVKTPSFWTWLKHKKNNFNGARIDMNALQQISNKINNKYNDNISQSEFVSTDFFRIKLIDSNGKEGMYGNNYNIHDGMNMNVKVKSSNSKTEMYVFKTKNSKPSLILVTNNDVFDVQNNMFTSKKFSASVSDARGKIGTMLFTVI